MTSHLLKKDYLDKVTKVTYEDYWPLYLAGFSDPESGRILDVSKSTIYNLRRKYQLVSQNPRNGKPNLTEYELAEAHKAFKESDLNYKKKTRKIKPEMFRQ